MIGVGISIDRADRITDRAVLGNITDVADVCNITDRANVCNITGRVDWTSLMQST